MQNFTELYEVERRYEELAHKMSTPDAAADAEAYAQMMRDYKELTPLIEEYRRYTDLQQQEQDAKEMLAAESDPAFAAMVQQELCEIGRNLAQSEENLRLLLIPKDADDEKSVILGKIPVSAAVNEAVEQTKTYANKRAAGLVNGSLRALARQKDTLAAPQDLATKYSHPQPLVDCLRASMDEETLEAFLAADNDIPKTALQCNPLIAAPEQVASALDEAQIPYEPHPWLPGCFLVSGTGNLEALPLFQSGAVYVQDPAAKLAALASGAAPGMRVLDCCAAPGGKSFAAAMQMENTGSILSCDLHPHKIALIEKNAARLGISILKAETRSAAEFDPALENGFDLVIADVPCSGLGVIRKKPDIRYKPLDAIERLPAIQTAILENVCRYVRPGGTLLYSTCTVRKEENEDVARTFLLAHPEFSPEPFAVPAWLDLKNEGYATLLPQKHAADGFFICKLRRHA